MDITWLQVAMNQIVVAQVLHAGRQVFQHQQELALREAVGILRVVQDVEEAATGAELHDDHLTSAVLLLLDRQQLHDVLVLDLLQDLELPHLHIVRPHVAQLIERLHRDRLPIVLVDALKHRAGRTLAEHAGGAPDIVGGSTKERHIDRARLSPRTNGFSPTYSTFPRSWYALLS